MSLSSKQLGMAWIHSKLDPKRIRPEEDELQALNGGKPIKEKVLEEAIEFIQENLANLRKTKYQPYVEKYCQTGGKPNDQASEEEHGSGDSLHADDGGDELRRAATPQRLG